MFRELCHVLVCTLLLIITAIPASATTLDYRDFVGEVFDRHPRVLQQVANAKEKESEISSARARRLPTIKVGGRYTSLDKESSEISMQVPIYTFGRISNEIELKGEEYRLENLRLLKVQNEVIAEATNLYLSYVYDLKKFGVLDNNYRELNQLLERIKRRRKTGYDSVADVNSAQSRVLQGRARAERLQIGLTSMLREISILYGQDVEEVLPTPTNLFRLDNPQDIVDLVMKQNPDVLLAEQQVVIAERNERLVRLNNRPNIDLVASEDLQNAFENSGSIGVQMNYSLENLGFSVSANLESAKFRKEAANQAMANASQDAAIEVSKTLNELGAVSQQITEQHTIIQALKDTKSSFTRQYEAGRKSLMEVLNIYNELAEAEQLLLDHERRKIGYEVKLYSLSGAIYLAALTDSLPDQVSQLRSSGE
jgi:outer membrane protein TolC